MFAAGMSPEFSPELEFLNLCFRCTWQARTRNARGGCVPAVERLRAGPASAVELEKKAPLHYAASQRSVVWKFLRGRGRFFQKEPLIILPYNGNLICDTIKLLGSYFREPLYDKHSAVPSNSTRRG